MSTSSSGTTSERRDKWYFRARAILRWNNGKAWNTYTTEQLDAKAAKLRGEAKSRKAVMP